MFNWFLSQNFNTQLSKKITLWIFCSLLTIATIIFVPSYINRQKLILNDLERISQTAVRVAFPETQSINSNIANTFLRNLQKESIIIGGRIYQEDGKLLATIGDNPKINLQVLNKEKKSQPLKFSEEGYDTAIYFARNNQPLWILLRHDAVPIQNELSAYTIRVIGLVILISIVITVVSMVVINRICVRPILYLRDDLFTAAKTISQDRPYSNFNSIRIRQKDELGEVIKAFESMYKQILQEIHRRKQAHRAEIEERERSDKLSQTLEQSQRTQVLLVQKETTTLLDKIYTGVVHEINNPINILYANVTHIENYFKNLLDLVHLYQNEFTDVPLKIKEFEKEIDLSFFEKDIDKINVSFKNSTQRITKLILALKVFSGCDDAQTTTIDINESIDNILVLLSYRLSKNSKRPEIEVVKNYRDIPQVECYSDLLNQVFMNLLVYGIDMLDDVPSEEDLLNMNINPSDWDWYPQLSIETSVKYYQFIQIKIKNNGSFLANIEQLQQFEDFCTDKSITEVTDIGLLSSYQIISEKHGGSLKIIANPNEPFIFDIELPIKSQDLPTNKITGM